MSEPQRPTQREYWNSKVGEEWANQADSMDRMLLPLTLPALELLALQPGERVLDIGCGAGATSLEIARRVGASGRVVGVDISQQLLTLARERAAAAGANADFIDADAGATDIPGAPFDAAFSRFGLMFFSDPPAAFARLRAQLKPGGRFVFITWRTFRENAWTHAPLTALAPILKAPVPPADPNAPGPFALSDASKIEAILAASGWRDVLIRKWDGDVLVGGGGDAQQSAKFLLKIGPCARAITDQNLDRDQSEKLLTDFLVKHQAPGGVALAAACWIVQATA